MSLWPFGRKMQPPAQQEDGEVLIPAPLPPLVDVLAYLEREKGAPLDEAEVLAARDQSPCMMLPRKEARVLAEKRGYDDIDPEFAWAQWQDVRGRGRST